MDTRLRDRDNALSEDEQLGVVLVKSGIITIDQLGEALGRAKDRGVNLARVLIEDRLLTEEQFVGTLAEQLGLDFVDLATYPVDASAARLVTETLARRYLALPIGWWEGRLIVAMADPSNVFAIDDIRALTGAEVRQVVATAEAINAAINKYHRKDSEAEHISAEASANSAPMEDDRLSNIKEVREDAPIVRLVNLLISQAITDRASDIHVEPTGKDVRIRYRIDGVLHETMRSPKNIQNGIISRLKVMADINIAERRIPQDGRITTNIDGKSVDLRVATLPTVNGEKVIMRILDNSTANLRLAELG
ncbi:MAG TPA: ATPase, T2SS/T4P/T4SS family, partial [Acidimicrobiales bacterium]|nr:ATPase, T2SS/T4P/T4SS family [Acidimicrobiales bacterium]